MLVVLATVQAGFPSCLKGRDSLGLGEAFIPHPFQRAEQAHELCEAGGRDVVTQPVENENSVLHHFWVSIEYGLYGLLNEEVF